MSNWTPKVGMLVKKIGGPTGIGRCRVGYTTVIVKAGEYDRCFTIKCADGTEWLADICNWVPVHTKHELNSPSYNNLYE